MAPGSAAAAMALVKGFVPAELGVGVGVGVGVGAAVKVLATANWGE